MEVLIEYYQRSLLGLSGFALAILVLIGIVGAAGNVGCFQKMRLLFRGLVFPRSPAAWICTVPLTCFLLVMGSEKSGGGSGANPPSLSAPRRLPHGTQETITSNDVARGYRISEGDEDGIVPPSAGAVTNEPLRRRGGYDWAFRVEPEGWCFPYRDGFLNGVTVLACGDVRPDVGTAYFPVPITNGVSLLPEARWGLLPKGGASVFSHALTTNGSLLLDWRNALVGRDPNSPTNLQMELFRDGRFAWRTDDASRHYLPVLPFDWDIPNVKCKM